MSAKRAVDASPSDRVRDQHWRRVIQTNESPWHPDNASYSERLLRAALEYIDELERRPAAILRRFVERQAASDARLADQERLLPLAFDIMGWIRACDETIPEDSIACPCTLRILEEIERRELVIDGLHKRLAEGSCQAADS